MTEANNCKVIKGESVAKQHYLLVGKINIKKTRKRKKRSAPKIMWWRMKDDEMSDIFCQRVLYDVKLKDDVEEWWQYNAQVILRTGEEIFGKTSGKSPPNGKETWWWNVEVAEVIMEKKVGKKEHYDEKNQIYRERLRVADKAAKKAVANARAEAREEMYELLETVEGQKKIYRIAKSWTWKTMDQTYIRHMKDENGNMLYNDNDIKRRWKDYFEGLLNIEYPRYQAEKEYHLKDKHTT